MNSLVNLLDYNLRIQKEQKRHKKAIDLLDNLLKEYQTTCSHPQDKIKYQGDPAGGNDSYHYCVLCDKVF